MKPEQLKLYNKYKNINNPNNTQFIYIGIDNNNYYCFLIKDEKGNNRLSFFYLINHGFNPHKIINNLNLEIVKKYGNKYITCYYLLSYSKEYIETNLKPILKDKLNNILNR